MKKIITHLLLCTLFVFAGLGVFAQGLEDFTNFPENTNSYHTGSFTGNDGSTWNYISCRGDSAISLPTPTLAKGKTPSAEMASGSIANGIGTISFDYKQVFSTAVALDILVNGTLITTVTSSAEQGIIKHASAIAVNVSGTFTLTFRQNSLTSGQVAIDNVSWTSFGGGTPDPEPSNYPTAFTVNGAGLNIITSWTDATGTQLPSGYLVKISTSNNITAPVDGTYIGDDLNLSDGSGSKNVQQGVQGYTFAGLNSASDYYVKIYPYTNAGSTVDYKTDGTAPSGSGRTQAILYEQNFNNGLAPWTQFSVLGDQVWVLDSIHGVDGSMCMKITGFVSATSTVANEDWLISPSMNIPGGSSPKLEFYTAMNYGTGSSGISAFVSTDYTTGAPSTATWTAVPGTINYSAGGWVWTSSGFSDLSSYTGSNVHVAFKYTCDAVSAPTWEVDNFRITNNSGVGFNENPKNSAISFYPNPCTSGFNTLYTGNEKFHMTVFNVDGSKLLEKNISQSGEFTSTEKLKEGIYLVRLANQNTNAIEVLKLIVK
ncbi:MAG: DUF5017 domain-containing protein [Bacteroidetes bacterium]|nr:DUF5017 domain-containing protein [Bacteroidota bacterium]